MRVGSSPQRGLIKRSTQCDGGKGELTPTRLLGKMLIWQQLSPAGGFLVIIVNE